MIKNYLLITVRSMMRNRLFIIVNVLGMGAAIACCIVSFFAYTYDATFDHHHKQGHAIYRVSTIREVNTTTTHDGYAPLPLGNITAKTMADVHRSSRFSASQSNFKREDDLFPANLMYVDPAFFGMFSFNMIAGQATTLEDNTSALISEVMAQRLFGSAQEAFGKTTTMVTGTGLKEVKIAGVFQEPPRNSSFYKMDGSAYMNFENYRDEYTVRDDDWTQETTLFLQIDDPTRVAGVHTQLQQYLDNNNLAHEDRDASEFTLDHFVTMAHTDRAGSIRAATWGAPPLSAIMATIVMSLLILLVACFNLTNTAIAISSQRLKEIGLRKVMGGKRPQLIMQFIGETTFICMLALLAGLGMADFLIAGWNLMTQDMIHLEPNYLQAPAFVAFLIGLLLFTGLIAGSYPAFYISRFEPVKILKGKVRFGRTSLLSRILLALQLAFSLIAVVSAIAFVQNAQYQRAYDLGFDIRGAVVVPVNNQSEFDTYRNALQSNADIISIAGAGNGIFSNPVHKPVKYETQQIAVDIIAVGDNYLKTMNLTLLEGRDFLKESETDQRESIIITQKMANRFGWDKPLGKQVIWKDSIKLYVVGVVKDVYTNGLWRELEPMMIRYVLPEHYKQVVVSTSAGRVPAVNAAMNQQWNKTFPNRIYPGSMLVNDLNYIDNLNLSSAYSYAFFGLVALLLSATGLFTLVSLNIIRRTKEIGVRKILGASAGNIARIVNFEFIIILLAASALGSWISFTMTHAILSSIWKYYQGVNALTFITAIGILLAVTLSTIGYKVMGVIHMDPVKTLRDE